jgi:C4-dicarboxylate-specific signal transduction histidine kinase
VHVCEFLWKYWEIETPEVLWAYTVATFMAVLYISMFLCFGRQVAYQNRLDEKARYCAELEQKLLKKRQSSSKHKQH